MPNFSRVSNYFVQGRFKRNSVLLQTIYLKKSFKTLNIAIMRLGGFTLKDTYSAISPSLIFTQAWLYLKRL